MPLNANEQYTLKVINNFDLLFATEQYTAKVVKNHNVKSAIEQYTINVSTIPAIADGPNWFGVVDGTVRWIPGTIYNNQRFVRYRIWDGTKWQTS